MSAAEPSGWRPADDEADIGVLVDMLLGMASVELEAPVGVAAIMAD